MKITGYEFGRIEIEGQPYTSDVIISGTEVRDGWWRQQGHLLRIDDLGDIEACAPAMLIIGTGFYGNMTVPHETLTHLEAKHIQVQVARTPEAVKLFNRLQRESATVVAALHLTC